MQYLLIAIALLLYLVVRQDRRHSHLKDRVKRQVDNLRANQEWIEMNLLDHIIKHK